MPFNWGLGGDVASIGLPQSKASPPMLISQGQEEPLQCFSFEGGLENTITGTLLYRRGKKKSTLNIYLFAKIKEASYRGVSGPTTTDRCFM